MIMVTYINKNVPGTYVVMAEELDGKLYNNVGLTYEEYLCGWWILLSEEQVKFHEAYPQASVKEVLDMELDVKPAVDELVEAKNRKLSDIQEYDQGDNVNAFMLNGVIKAWFSVQERLNYKQSVEAAKLLGEETLDFLVNGMPFSVGVTQAEYMLAQIQRYADKCYMVTQQHIANVNALSSVEEVEYYDYTQGYPTMLSFEL